MHINNPTIALLSNGSEEGKGNKLVRETYQLLKQSSLNFIGNVEGNNILQGKANVIVCDGFVGNILVKFCEGLGRLVSKWFTQRLADSLNTDDAEKLASKLYGLMSPGVVMGGGPLLGVDGVAAVAHGSSRAPQIVGTIKQAKVAVESGFVNTLRAELEQVQARLSPE